MPNSFSKTSPADQDPHFDEHPQQVTKKEKTFRSKSSIHECLKLARRAVSFLKRFTTDRQTLFDQALWDSLASSSSRCWNR